MKKLMLFIFIPLFKLFPELGIYWIYPAEGRHHPITFSFDKFGFIIAGQK